MRTRLSRAAHTSIFKYTLLLLVGLAPVAVQAVGVRMVSVDAAGSAAGQATTGGGLEHKNASMSADAGKVLYSSLADNLTSPLADNDDELGVSDNVFDVFVWERSSGANSVVALNLGGTSSGDGAGILGHISADGSQVAFINDSTNLAVDEPNPIPTPTPDGDDHVYLLSGGDLTFLTLNFDASSPAGGSPGAQEVQVGNNGKVFFTWFPSNSSAEGLIDDKQICDRNGDYDLYVYDPASSADNKVELLSISTNPDFPDAGCDPAATDKTANDGVSDIMVNASGDKVVFVSAANDLISPQIEADFDDDVFLWDNGTIKMVSKNATGDDGGNGQSINPIISADGSTVVFESNATDLVAGISDGNGSRDVFVWTEALGVRLVSVNETGLATGNAGAFNPSVSGNGNLVVFDSDASDLTATDNQTSTQIYLRNVLNNTTEMVSLKANPTDPMVPEGSSGGASNPLISEDGSTVAFKSVASDLTGGTVSGSLTQIYVRDLALGVNQLLTPGTTTGEGANGASHPIQISADGRYVLLSSAATDMAENVDDMEIPADDLFLAEQLGFVEFDAAEYEVTEGDSGNVLVTVTVNRLKAGDSEASVDYKTDDADAETTATAGVDYTSTTGTLTWSAGETGPKQFTVDVAGDAGAEADEFIRIVLENPTGTSIGNQGSAKIKIVNDDEDCGNSVNDDPDEDSDVDCADSDCDSDPNCQESGNCGDGLDNDQDTDVDCDDSDCTGDPACSEICDDGSDNDNDTLADCDDPDCSSAPNCLNPEVCNNGLDDDNDTLADCLDSDCAADPACTDPSGDGDGDGFINSSDNCPGVSNPGQEDTDADGVGNACDTTEDDCGNNQNDDGDGLSDCGDPDCAASNECVDSDSDAIVNADDNCPNVNNPGQEDTDGDGAGNACDTAEGACANGVSDDTDGDIDCADADCAADPACAAPADDDDGDGVLNATDNCPSVANPTQENTDGDGLGNACDNSEGDCDNGVTDDTDALVDCADSNCAAAPNCLDSDSDGVPNITDNCDNVANPGQEDTDADGTGNACDGSEGLCNNGASDDSDADVDCADADCTADPVCANPGGDDDSDGVLNASDNCPADANPGQENGDGDGFGDACDNSEGDCSNGVNDDVDGDVDCADSECSATPNCVDDDGDGVPNVFDNCPADFNDTQDDSDFDGVGDVCDALPFDFDNDGVDDFSDNCFDVPNPGQEETDGDFIGNACDFEEGNCVNGDDDDNDALVDCQDSDCSSAQACAALPDDDGDGIPNVADNCPSDANADQADTDGDGAGNVCDANPDVPEDDDEDGPGVPTIPPGSQPAGGGGLGCSLNGAATTPAIPLLYVAMGAFAVGSWRWRLGKAASAPASGR